MKSISFSEGSERTRVSLRAEAIGDDFVVYLFNDYAHLGAVALSDYSHAEKRASTSVITRLGHKDDTVAGTAAYRVCKALKRPVCAVAGIHLDGITKEEIAQITSNCEKLVERLVGSLQSAVGSEKTVDLIS
jgi:gallate decarboxylase subunit D